MSFFLAAGTTRTRGLLDAAFLDDDVGAVEEVDETRALPTGAARVGPLVGTIAETVAGAAGVGAVGIGADAVGALAALAEADAQAACPPPIGEFAGVLWKPMEVMSVLSSE